MNSELKQRLIGAVVITALAAIFIPMLFDDPVDNSSQSVTNLVIPETPINTGEVSANKLPTSANQVLNAPDAASKTIVETQEEAELSSTDQPPSTEPLPDEAVVEEPTDPSLANEDTIPPREAADDDSAPLDTGVVDEPVVAPKAVSIAKTKVKVPVATSDDSLDVMVDVPVKKPKSTTSEAKPVTKTSADAKPAKGFSRWTIQAGTFSKKENALTLMETLRKQGLPVHLDSSKGLYLLKIGPVLDKKRALEMKAKVDGQKVSSMLIAE